MSFKLLYTNGAKTFYTENNLDEILQHIRNIIKEDETWIIKTTCNCGLEKQCMSDDCIPSQFILRVTDDNFVDPLLTNCNLITNNTPI